MSSTNNLSLMTMILMVYLCLVSCRQPLLINDEKLIQALELSGDNREELEDVLRHYSDPRDSLKYKSAVFLIKHMPGKFAKVFPAYDEYKLAFDTLIRMNEAYEKTYTANNAEFYKYYKRSVFNYFMEKHRLKETATLDYEIREDIKTITGDYLIENIDYAFMAWQMPWNKNLSFEDFCEYILPYRYGHEELQPWRKAFYEGNIHLLDSFKTEKDPVKICMYLKGMRDVSRSEMTELRGLSLAIHPLDLIEINTTTSCKDETGVVLLRLRALGIPLARITFPKWGNRSSGHDINGILTLQKEWMPLSLGTDTMLYTPPPQFKIAKVYVETYSNNDLSSFISGIPGSLSTISNYIDITKSITSVSDLTVPFKDSMDGTQSVLCIFDNAEWTPIVSSVVEDRKSIFPDIGREVVYMAGTIILGNLKLEGNPFLLDSAGSLIILDPSKKNESVRLYRKYPPNEWLNSLISSMDGSYFQGSNDSKFENAVTLWRVNNLTSLHTLNKNIRNARYQYVRLVFPHIVRVNEALGGIQFYSGEDAHKQLLNGKPISTIKASNIFYNNIFDDNPLTYVRLLAQNSADFTQFYNGESLVIPDQQLFWVGLNFLDKMDLTSLGFSLRTDDNDINIGESYELFYWDNQWISLGRKKALTNDIEFHSPKNSLLLLRNIDKGVENRIFIYKDSKQRWY